VTDNNDFDDFNEIEALIAAGGNSRLALSLRARRQLRDPGGENGGQWIYMGGGLKRALRRLFALLGRDKNGNAKPVRITGTVTQPGSGDKNIEIYVNPKQAREAGIRSGFYDVDVSATSEVEAELSTEALQRAGVKTPAGARVTTATPDLSSITRRDVPLGWKDLGTNSDGNRHYETEGGDFDVTTTSEGKFLIKDKLTGESYEADDWVDAIATVNRTLIEEAGEKVPESKEEAAAMQNRAKGALRDALSSGTAKGKGAAAKKPTEKTSAQLADEIVALEGKQQDLDPMDKDFDKKDAALQQKIDATRAQYKETKAQEDTKVEPEVVTPEEPSNKDIKNQDEEDVVDITEDGEIVEKPKKSPARERSVGFQTPISPPMTKEEREAAAAANQEKFGKLADQKFLEQDYGYTLTLAKNLATSAKFNLRARPGETKEEYDNRVKKTVSSIIEGLVKRSQGKKAKELYATLNGDKPAESFEDVYGKDVPDVPPVKEGTPVTAEDITDVETPGRDDSLIADVNNFQKSYKDAFKKHFNVDSKDLSRPKIKEHFKSVTGRELSDEDATKLLALRKTDAFKALEAKINQQAALSKDNQDLTREEAFNLLDAADAEITALGLDDEELQDMLLDDFRSDDLFEQVKFKKDVKSTPVATIPAADTNAPKKLPFSELRAGDVVTVDGKPVTVRSISTGVTWSGIGRDNERRGVIITFATDNPRKDLERKYENPTEIKDFDLVSRDATVPDLKKYGSFDQAIVDATPGLARRLNTNIAERRASGKALTLEQLLKEGGYAKRFDPDTNKYFVRIDERTSATDPEDHEVEVSKEVYDAFIVEEEIAATDADTATDELLSVDTSNMSYDEKVEFGQKLWDARAAAAKEQKDKTAGVEFLRKLAEIDPDMAEYYKAVDKINEWKGRPDADQTHVQNAIAALQSHYTFEVWPTLLKRYVKGTDKLPVKGAPRAKSVVPEKLLKDPVAKTATPATPATSATPADVKTAAERFVPYGEDGGTTRVTRLENGDIEIEKFGPNGQSLRLGVAVIKKKDISPSGLLGVVGGRPGESVIYHIPTGLVIQGNRKFLEAKKLTKDLDASDVDMDWGWTDGVKPYIKKTEALRDWLKARQQAQTPATPATPKVGDNVATIKDFKNLPAGSTIILRQGTNLPFRYTRSDSNDPNNLVSKGELQTNSGQWLEQAVLPSDKDITYQLGQRESTVERVGPAKPEIAPLKVGDQVTTLDELKTLPLNTVIFTPQSGRKQAMRLTVGPDGKVNGAQLLKKNTKNVWNGMVVPSEEQVAEFLKERTYTVETLPEAKAPAAPATPKPQANVLTRATKAFLLNGKTGDRVFFNRRGGKFQEVVRGDDGYWYDANNPDTGIASGEDLAAALDQGSISNLYKGEFPRNDKGVKLSSEAFQALKVEQDKIDAAKKAARTTKAPAAPAVPATPTSTAVSDDDIQEILDKYNNSIDEMQADYDAVKKDYDDGVFNDTLERKARAELVMKLLAAAIDRAKTPSGFDSPTNKAYVQNLEKRRKLVDDILNRNANGQLSLSPDRVDELTKYRDDIDFAINKSREDNVAIPTEVYNGYINSKVADLSEEETAVSSTGDPYNDLKNSLLDPDVDSALSDVKDLFDYVDELDEISDEDRQSLIEALNTLVEAVETRMRDFDDDPEVQELAQEALSDIKKQVNKLLGIEEEVDPNAFSDKDVDDLIAEMNNDVEALQAKLDQIRAAIDSGRFDDNLENKANFEKLARIHEAAIKKLKAASTATTTEDSDEEIARKLKRERLKALLGEEDGDAVLSLIDDFNSTIEGLDDLSNRQDRDDLRGYLKDIEQLVGDTPDSQEIFDLISELTDDNITLFLGDEVDSVDQLNDSVEGAEADFRINDPELDDEFYTKRDGLWFNVADGEDAVGLSSEELFAKTENGYINLQGPGDEDDETTTTTDEENLTPVTGIADVTGVPRGSRVVIRYEDDETKKNIFEFYQVREDGTTSWRRLNPATGKFFPESYTAADLIDIQKRRYDPSKLKRMEGTGQMFINQDAGIPDGAEEEVPPTSGGQGQRDTGAGQDKDKDQDKDEKAEAKETIKRFKDALNAYESFTQILNDIEEIGEVEVVYGTEKDDRGVDQPRKFFLNAENYADFVDGVNQDLTDLGQNLNDNQKDALRGLYNDYGVEMDRLKDARLSMAEKKRRIEEIMRRRKLLAGVINGKDYTEPDPEPEEGGESGQGGEQPGTGQGEGAKPGGKTPPPGGPGGPGGGGGSGGGGGGGGRRPRDKEPRGKKNWWDEYPELVEEELPINSRTDFNAPIFQDKRVRKLIDIQRRLEDAHREYNRVRKMIENADQMGIISRTELLRDFNFWRGRITILENQIAAEERKLNISIKDLDDRINEEMKSGDYVNDEGAPYSPTADRFADGPVGADPRAVFNAWQAFKDTKFMPLKVDDIISNIDYLEDRVRRAYFDAREAQKNPDASASEKAAAFANFQRAEKERSDFVTDSYKFLQRLDPNERALWDRWAYKRSVQIRKMYDENDMVGYIKHIEFFGGLIPLIELGKKGKSDSQDGQPDGRGPSGPFLPLEGNPPPKGPGALPSEPSKPEPEPSDGDGSRPSAASEDEEDYTESTNYRDFLSIPIEEFARRRKQALRKWREYQELLGELNNEKSEYANSLDNPDEQYLTDEQREILNGYSERIAKAQERQETVQRVIAAFTEASGRRPDRGRAPKQEDAEEGKGAGAALPDEIDMSISTVDDLNSATAGDIVSNGVDNFVRGSDGLWYAADDAGVSDNTRSYSSSEVFDALDAADGQSEISGSRAPFTPSLTNSERPVTSQDRNQSASRTRVTSADIFDVAPTGARISRDVIAGADGESTKGARQVSLDTYAKGEDGQWYRVSPETDLTEEDPISDAQKSALISEIDSGMIFISDKKQSLRDALSDQQNSTGTGAASRVSKSGEPDNFSKIRRGKVGGYKARTYTAEQVYQQTGITPSEQQLKIINDFGQNQSMVIVARAGTGKTSTLKLLSDMFPEHKILLAAFNRSTAEEAAARFGANVQARTLDSLGFFGVEMTLDDPNTTYVDSDLKATKRATLNAKLDLSMGAKDGRSAKLDSTSFMSAYEATELYGIEEVVISKDDKITSDIIFSDLMSGIANGFASTADRKITLDHLLPHMSSALRKKVLKDEALAWDYVKIAQRMWDENITVPITIKNKLAFSAIDGQPFSPLPVTNSMLSKIWQLSGLANVVKKVPGGSTADTLFVDEAQDLNAAQIDLVNQLAMPNEDGLAVQVVVVGDNRQALYAFRGAVNQMFKFYDQADSVADVKNGLTKTYRSPQALVDVANVPLWLMGEPLRTTSGKSDEAPKGKIFSRILPPEVLKKMTPEIQAAIKRAGGTSMPTEQVDMHIEATNTALLGVLPTYASAGRRVAINANRREEFITNIEALSLMQMRPTTRSRKEAFANHEMGVFQNYPDLRLNAPGTSGEQSIMDKYRKGGAGLSSKVIAFLRVAEEFGMISDDTKTVKEKSSDGKTIKKDVVVKAVERRQEMLRLIRQTVSPKPSYLISGQKDYVEEYEGLITPNIPQRMADLDGDGFDFEPLVPGRFKYAVTKGKSSELLNLRITGSNIGLLGFRQRLERSKRDLLADPNISDRLREELELIKFNTTDKEFEGMRIANVYPGSDTVNVLLKEAAKARSRIEALDKDKLMGDVSMPTDAEFRAAGGKPIVKQFYTSTNFALRDEDGNVLRDPDKINKAGNPSVILGEGVVELLFERNEGTKIVTVSILDGGLKYQADASVHNPLSKDALNVLGFESTYREAEKADKPTPGEFSKFYTNNLGKEDKKRTNSPNEKPSLKQNLPGLIDFKYSLGAGNLVTFGLEGAPDEEGTPTIESLRTYIVSEGSDGEDMLTLWSNGKAVGSPKPREEVVGQFIDGRAKNKESTDDLFYAVAYAQYETIRPGQTVFQMSAVDKSARTKYSALIDGTKSGDPYTDELGYDVALLTVHGAKGLEAPNVKVGDSVFAFWEVEKNADGEPKRELRDLSDDEIMQQANMLYVALSRAEEAMDIGNMARLLEIAATVEDLLQERGIDKKDLEDYDIWSTTTSAYPTDFFIEQYKEAYEEQEKGKEKGAGPASTSSRARRASRATMALPEGINLENPSVQWRSPTSTSTHYQDFPALPEPFDNSLDWRRIPGDAPFPILEKFSEEQLLGFAKFLVDRNNNPSLEIPTGDPAIEALYKRKTNLRGLYEGLIFKRLRAKENAGVVIPEVRRQFAALFDGELDKLNAYFAEPADAPEVPEVPEVPVAPDTPEVAPPTETVTPPKAPRKPRPPRKPAQPPAEPVEETPAPKASEDVLDILKSFDFLMGGDSADKPEDSGKGAGSRQAPTTGQSQLSPDTMAEIFDRYALLAQYRKAMSEGRMSVPLEYSAGGVANRYNASIEEIMQALELMGFTPDELA